MAPDDLERVAQQLVGRVRTDEVDDFTRWLTDTLPDPADWFRLAVALACAVPDDRTWLSLTAWTHGWQPIKVDPRDDLDHIAIERACFGDEVKLTAAERAYAVALLDKHGLSAREIGDRLRLTQRTVQRYRGRRAAA